MKQTLTSILLCAAIYSAAQTKIQFTPDKKFALLPIEQIQNIYKGLIENDSCQTENKHLRGMVIESNRDIIEIDSLYIKTKQERAGYLKERDAANARAFKLEIDNEELQNRKIKHWSIGPSVQVYYDDKTRVSPGLSLQYSLIRF